MKQCNSTLETKYKKIKIVYRVWPQFLLCLSRRRQRLLLLLRPEVINPFFALLNSRDGREGGAKEKVKIPHHRATVTFTTITR